MKPWILIPAYHPDEKLLHLLESLHAAGLCRILVVNDGSGPDCDGIFSEIRRRWSSVTVLAHETNRGKGGALKTAFRYLLEHADSSSQGVVTADADGQHTVPDIQCVMDEMERAPEALVLGVRMFEGRVPLRSAFGNRLTRFLLRLLYGVRIPDTQTGLRGIPRAMMERCLEIPSDRYEFELDMLLAAVSGGIEIRSVPIRTIYIDNNASSHFHPLRDSARIYSVLFRNLFRKKR